MVTKYIPNIINNFTSMLIGIGVSISFSWKIGLLSIFLLPAIAFAGYLSISLIGGFDDDNDQLYNNSDKIADEMIVNIKTIFSLNYEKRMLEWYTERLLHTTGSMIGRGAKMGALFGFSFFVLFSAIGGSLFGGAGIVASDVNMDRQAAGVAFVTCVWCGWLTGNNFIFIAHSATGKKSAKEVFKFLDAKTEE